MIRMTKEMAQFLVDSYGDAVLSRSRWAELSEMDRQVALANVFCIRDACYEVAIDADLPAVLIHDLEISIGSGWEGWDRFISGSRLDDLMMVMLELDDPNFQAVGRKMHINS